MLLGWLQFRGPDHFVFWVLKYMSLLPWVNCMFQTAHCSSKFNGSFLFQVTGLGPTCYVQVAQMVTTPRSSLGQAGPGVPGPAKGSASNSNTAVIEHEATVGGDTDIYQDKPKLVQEPVKKRLFDPPSSASPPPSVPGAGVSTPPSPVTFREEESKRLSSETRRLLLCHQEHAMTLSELMEHFSAEGDPANPSAESLYQALMTHGGGSSSGDGPSGQNKFEVCINRKIHLLIVD